MSKYSYEPQPECGYCFRLDKPFCTSQKQARNCDDYAEYFAKPIEENEQERLKVFNRILEERFNK